MTPPQLKVETLAAQTKYVRYQAWDPYPSYAVPLLHSRCQESNSDLTFECIGYLLAVSLVFCWQYDWFLLAVSLQSLPMKSDPLQPIIELKMQS